MKGNLEPLEVGARLIYGEAPWWIPDKQCVAWVLWNRRESSSYPDTLYDVCVESGQFAAITGGANATYDQKVIATAAARNPNIDSTSWQNALRFASIIWAAAALGGTPDGALPRPEGFDGQMYFRSYSGFFNNATGGSGQPYLGGEQIKDIFIPVFGSFTNVNAAKAAYDNSQNPALGRPYDAEGERVNIYFSYGEQKPDQ